MNNLPPIIAAALSQIAPRDPYASSQARYDREQDAAFDRGLRIERAVEAAMKDPEQIAEALGDIALAPIAEAIARVDATTTVPDLVRESRALCGLFRKFFEGRAA